MTSPTRCAKDAATDAREAGMSKPRLLIVDDDREIAAFMSGIGVSAGYDVTTADSAETFKTALDEIEPTVIILDLTMPGTDGIELLHYLAEARTRSRILIVSGYDEGIRRMARDIGVARGLDMAGVIAKPVRAAELRVMLEQLGLESRPPR